MKRIALLLLFPLLMAANGCKKDSGSNPSSTPGFTVFKNQTGNPDADALQAQHIDNENQAITNFYGKFDANGNPAQLLSATYQKIGNDTIVHMISDPVTDHLQTMFYEVKGVKQPVVMKFEFMPGNDSSFRFSLYTYDWHTNTGTLQFQSMVYAINGAFQTDPLFANFKTTNMKWTDMTQILSVSLYIVQYVMMQSLWGSALSSQIAGLNYLQNVWFYLLTALYQTHLSLNHFSTAGITPSSTSYPGNTPANNPSTASNPTPHLGASPCDNTVISFFADRDEQGTVTISGVNGGTPPYKYSSNGFTAFETNATLSGTFEKNKKYTFTVKDAKGCMGSMTLMW